VGSKGQVVKAMVLIRRPRDSALLVSEGVTPAGEVFHRPLGGHVEHGERATDTIYRELAEEIGQALSDVRLTGVLENIFTWNGAIQHEIVFVFTAALADHAAYEIPEQLIRDAATKTRVIWRSADTVSPPLFPAGIAEIATSGAAT
jgi:ADP-ribose pyrophosphatase YjhB (NUDIX family)